MPLTGFFGIMRLDGRLDPGEVRALADRIGAAGAVVTDGRAAIFAGGWGQTHHGADGVYVIGHAHLVNCDNPPGELHMAPPLEVVAATYRTYGQDVFAHLHGQFCLVIYDPAAGRVLLATDRFATRVLYHAQVDGAVLFGSRLSDFPRELRTRLDSQALFEYLLYTAIPHPRTPYAQIRKLCPGHLLVTDPGVRVVPYWDMSYAEQRNGAVSGWASRLRCEIEAAVRRHVAAEDGSDDVGAFLSGGTDSSTVAGMMAAITGSPTKVFSIGYAESGYDELSYARTAANWFNLKHHEHYLTPAEAFGLLADVTRYYDEPFGNSSALPTYSCVRLARERGVRVLFAGDGGDELFAGNERYHTNAIFGLYQRVPRFLRTALTDPLLGTLPDGAPVLGRAGRYVRRANIANPRRLFSYNLLFTEPLPALLSADFLSAVDCEQLLATAEAHYHHLPPGTSELNRLLYLDLKLAIADNDVRKVSGMAELAGVEVRYPLLDTTLAEFSGRIPSQLKMRGLEKRYLFKQALADVLPPSILRKAKHGFGAPLALWMRTDPQWRELVADILHDRRTRERGYLLPAVLDSVWRQHQTEQSSYYGDLLWPVLMLELWHREHADGSRGAG